MGLSYEKYTGNVRCVVTASHVFTARNNKQQIRFQIGGSIFPHKRIHKANWVSPDQTAENWTDHICIKFRRSLQDIKEGQIWQTET